MTNKWEIAFFAGLAERLEARSMFFNWEENQLTAGQIKERLSARFPEHADILSLSFVAQNQAYANDETMVSSTDELALLPPVSGGSDEHKQLDEGASLEKRFVIVEQPIDVNSIISLVSHPDHGAAIAFVGTTREWTAGQRTLTLEYEAYIPMAKSALVQIGEEINRQWPGTLCAIAHRIGSVGIGEISVVIAVSSSHRVNSYEASRYAIERLKQTVPIWKKEVYEDGTQWKGHQLGPWDPTATLDKSGGISQ